MSSTIINSYICYVNRMKIKFLFIYYCIIYTQYKILRRCFFGSEHSLVYCITSWSLWYIEIHCHRSCWHLLVMSFKAITLNYISWKSFIRHVYFLQRWMQLYCVVDSSKFILWAYHVNWIANLENNNNKNNVTSILLPSFRLPDPHINTLQLVW